MGYFSFISHLFLTDSSDHVTKVSGELNTSISLQHGNVQVTATSRIALIYQLFDMFLNRGGYIKEAIAGFNCFSLLGATELPDPF